MSTDYAPKLDEEIEICGRCGDRLKRLGPDAAPYCYRCGDNGKTPPVTYIRADVCVRIEKDSATGGSVNAQ